MKLFGQIIGTLIETAKLPVNVVLDVVQVPHDLVYEKDLGHRTEENLERIKDEAKGEAER